MPMERAAVQRGQAWRRVLFFRRCVLTEALMRFDFWNLLPEILERLVRIEAGLHVINRRQIAMDASTQAQFDAINTELDGIAADIQILKDQVNSGATPAD